MFLIVFNKILRQNFKKTLVCKDWSRPKNTKFTWDYPGETRGNLRFFSAHGKAMAILAMLGWLWHMISSDPPKLIWFSSPIFLTVCLLECNAILSSSPSKKKTFPSSYQAGCMCPSMYPWLTIKKKKTSLWHYGVSTSHCWLKPVFLVPCSDTLELILPHSYSHEIRRLVKN